MRIRGDGLPVGADDLPAKMAWTHKCLIALVAGAAAGELKEPRTGINFPEKRNGASLNRLGVRTKGPIKVYAVGEYEDGSYMLKMSYGVGAPKMVSALADALKPRCSDSKAIEDFEACLLKGLPDGASKGTEMVFSTGGGKLGVQVNRKNVGTIGSKALSAAFPNIYCDSNAVCSMYSVGADGEEGEAAGGLITPQRGAIVGAALGYGLGKLLS